MRSARQARGGTPSRVRFPKAIRSTGRIPCRILLTLSEIDRYRTRYDEHRVSDGVRALWAESPRPEFFLWGERSSSSQTGAEAALRPGPHTQKDSILSSLVYSAPPRPAMQWPALLVQLRAPMDRGWEARICCGDIAAMVVMVYAKDDVQEMEG